MFSYPSSKTKYTFSSHTSFNKASVDEELEGNREQDKNCTCTINNFKKRE